MEQLFGDLGTLVASEDELRAEWSDPHRRAAFMQRLGETGYDADRLEDMQRSIEAPNSDIFDVLAYIRFTLAPLARSERVGTARSRGSHQHPKRPMATFCLQNGQTNPETGQELAAASIISIAPQEHFEWPQAAQVMQPSTMRIS